MKQENYNCKLPQVPLVPVFKPLKLRTHFWHRLGEWSDRNRHIFRRERNVLSQLQCYIWETLKTTAHRLSKWQEELKHLIPKMPRSVSHSILLWKTQLLPGHMQTRSYCLSALQQAEEQNEEEQGVG